VRRLNRGLQLVADGEPLTFSTGDLQYSRGWGTPQAGVSLRHPVGNHGIAESHHGRSSDIVKYFDKYRQN